ncbi:MAG: hypothetical protein GVY13_05995 [Alphaproteobacteria bacterium]|jgi:hypothetical protein|nr:hypothetical protein [Alphaproteobacteria bacterium]
MYELLLIACVGARFCEYVVSPIAYPTQSRCAANAALLAGTVRGRYDPAWAHEFRFVCRTDDGRSGGWTVVEVRGEDAQPADGLASAD